MAGQPIRSVDGQMEMAEIMECARSLQFKCALVRKKRGGFGCLARILLGMTENAEAVMLSVVTGITFGRLYAESQIIFCSSVAAKFESEMEVSPDHDNDEQEFGSLEEFKTYLTRIKDDLRRRKVML